MLLNFDINLIFMNDKTLENVHNQKGSNIILTKYVPSYCNFSRYLLVWGKEIPVMVVWWLILIIFKLFVEAWTYVSVLKNGFRLEWGEM